MVVEDILSGIDKEEDARVEHAQPLDAPEPLPLPGQAAPGSGWLLAAVLVIVVGIAVLVVAWWVFYRGGQNPFFPAPSLSLPAAPAVILPAPAAVSPPPPTPLLISPKLEDSDQDGLTDADEARLGSDPTLPDTDSDGLSDYDELVVFGTNPRSVDSDADGYRDGDEVRNGYNPKGPGRLLDLEGALQKK